MAQHVITSSNKSPEGNKVKGGVGSSRVGGGVPAKLGKQ